MKKYLRIFAFALFFVPCAAMSAGNDFMVAAQLLSAARNADIGQVQALVNNGADVNFVDSTGLSIVCTALMNNDVRAAQILQMYGADASKCDQQIKKYNSRNKTKERSGGLFSGLSSAHTLTLAAAGAAVVVGGLLLLTDVFDSGSSNSSGGGGLDRPNNGGDNGGGGVITEPTYTIPYGPAFLDAEGKIAYSQAAYESELAAWNPAAGGIRKLDFDFFRPDLSVPNQDGTGSVINPYSYVKAGITVPMQNYLLMMHGYASFANGYMGQGIFRNNNIPVKVANGTGGGRPVVVGVVTENGVNPTGSVGRGTGITYADSAAANANTYTVDKYLNFASACAADGTCGAQLVGVDGLANQAFDLSGSGGAINPFASPNQNALAKIIAGWEAGGRSSGDLYGFVPNGRLSIYKTGGGKEFVDNPGTDSIGTLTNVAGGTAGKIAVGDTLELNGKIYKIDAGDGVTNSTITVGDTIYDVPAGGYVFRGTCDSSTSGGCTGVSDIAIYLGTDGYYYVSTTGGSTPDAVYTIKDDNKLYVQKTLNSDVTVRTFQAIYNARNGVNVVANTTLNPRSRDIDYLSTDGFDTVLALTSTVDPKITFGLMINDYYEKGTDNAATTQGGYANSLFNSYSSSSPMLIMPAGEFAFGQGDGKTTSILEATFENYAPLLYDSNLLHQFMTVVGVRNKVGTAAASSIADYGNGFGSKFGKFELAYWRDDKGTEETTDDIVYMSRKCGKTGSGKNGIDPWCFAATGPTAEMATASAAGAVAAIKGAFDMSARQIFVLLALTADGPYLGTDSGGNRFTKDGLVQYLRDMYELPAGYDSTNLSSDEYLVKFAEVFGYGLINLERAMKPGTSIYYNAGSNVAVASGNAYWRAAAKTAFRASSAFSPRVATISAPFFDVLESVDGELRMPRVWKNEFAIGTGRRHGLSLNDVFGDLKTRDTNVADTQIGALHFSMATSQRAYADNMGGLDSMKLGFNHGNWDFTAQYQHNFTDGAGLFNGMANPIMSLAHDAVISDVKYGMGRWSFGARAFSGAITDSELLESDPTITAQYAPARLGLMHGGAVNAEWHAGRMNLDTSVGVVRETETVLGAYTDGLLNLGGGDTSYVDVHGRYRFADNVSLNARATFARTTANGAGQYIMGINEVHSNAFAIGADFGNFEFAVSQPLAVRSGHLKYAFADYDTVETADGKFDIAVRDTGVRSATLRPAHRETRLAATYRHSFGEFTDGAVGFIYRINPNNTDEFGNESVFMLKMSHRLGI